MTQTQQYVDHEADKWFDRNTKTSRNCFTEYLVSLFPRAALSKFDVAEIGIGRGGNLLYLQNFVRSIHGYDGSKKAAEHCARYGKLLGRDDTFKTQQLNACTDFTLPYPYDIVIYGFLSYMIPEDELIRMKNNVLHMLKNDSYIFIYDFLAKENREKPDAYNPNLNVYKRNLSFWMNHFDEFDLVDFRLFDNDHLSHYLLQDSPSFVDTRCTGDDKNWTFSALFKRRTV